MGLHGPMGLHENGDFATPQYVHLCFNLQGKAIIRVHNVNFRNICDLMVTCQLRAKKMAGH